MREVMLKHTRERNTRMETSGQGLLYELRQLGDKEQYVEYVTAESITDKDMWTDSL
jgi:hypothetical protein